MNLTQQTQQIQRHVGAQADGKWGPATAVAVAKALGIGVPTPFDRKAFLARYVNLSAAAITADDIEKAAAILDVTPAHIRMVRAVESGGRSFDPSGRPVILFEPHIFHARTGGAFSPSSFSYAHWKDRPYPATFDGRWLQMADAAEHDESAALESASWGLFQVMGFHWKALGYDNVQAFAAHMAISEAAHLAVVVKFIKVSGLAQALKQCQAGDPESCRAFAKGYNGAGYAANNYHVKLSAALK